MLPADSLAFVEGQAGIVAMALLVVFGLNTCRIVVIRTSRLIPLQLLSSLSNSDESAWSFCSVSFRILTPVAPAF